MRKFFYYLLVGVTLLTGLVYFISCFIPIISPVRFWPMAYLSLGFPYLLMAIILLLLIWLFIKKKAALYLLVLVLCGIVNIRSTFALNFFNNSNINTTNSIRVLGWNVKNFDNPANHADSANSIRNRMFNYIRQVNPDVICLQEMVEYIGPSFLSNIQALHDMGYTYYFKPSEIDTQYPFGTLASSNAIFSRFPIIDSGQIILNDPSHPKKIIYADIMLDGAPVRFITTHFRSYYFSPNPTDPPLAFHFDTGFIYRTSNIEKIKYIQQEHASEALTARNVIESSPHPVIFSADMNTVPSSYAYYKTKGNLRDVFLNKGKGLGASMDSLPPTLRIDYIFTDKKIEIINYRQDKISLSDHYPHYTDVRWKR